MVAPYRKKDSVLEMSPREKEARRQAALRKLGRDAIERVYPEGALVGAGKAASQAAKRLVKSKTVDDLPSVRMPPKRMKIRMPPKRMKKQWDPYEDEVKKQPPRKVRAKEALEKARELEEVADKNDTIEKFRKLLKNTARVKGVETGLSSEDEEKYAKGGVVKRKTKAMK
jgi:hypothetical protein